MKLFYQTLLVCLLVGMLSCTSLNYPSTRDSSPAEATRPSGPPAAPILLDLGFGEPEEDITAEADPAAAASTVTSTRSSTPPSALSSTAGSETAESRQPWFELTKQAREDHARGKFEDVQTKLEQAALQLASRPATNAQRRAVFGLRARLARDFSVLERYEEADALADTLFSEASESPGLGGTALADLAYSVASRREAEAEEAGVATSQLPLLRIALRAAENEPASKVRMNRAFEISEAAIAEDDYALAREAIDRAVLDAQIVAPSNKDQLASLKIYKARIALAQGDLLAAEASAIAANRLFEDIDAPSPNRAVAESEMARVVAAAGDEDRARAILAGAQARMEGDPPLPVFAKRVVLGASARVERSFGNAAAARDYYRQALDLPRVEFPADRSLIIDLSEELAALDSPESRGTSESSEVVEP